MIATGQMQLEAGHVGCSFITARQVPAVDFVILADRACQESFLQLSLLPVDRNRRVRTKIIRGGGGWAICIAAASRVGAAGLVISI